MQTRREKKRLKFEAKQRRRAERMADRANHPQKLPSEAFMSCRATYHDHWCSAMNGVWLSGSNRVNVVEKLGILASAEPCLLCAKITEDL